MKTRFHYAKSICIELLGPVYMHRIILSNKFLIRKLLLCPVVGKLLIKAFLRESAKTRECPAQWEIFLPWELSLCELCIRYVSQIQFIFRAGNCTFFGGRNLLLGLWRAAGWLFLGGRRLPAPFQPALRVCVDGVLHISQGMLPVEEIKIRYNLGLEYCRFPIYNVLWVGIEPMTSHTWPARSTNWAMATW